MTEEAPCPHGIRSPVVCPQCDPEAYERARPQAQRIAERLRGQDGVQPDAVDGKRACVLLGFRRGGGLVFLVESDRVLIFQPRVGAAENEPMELIGVANREHVALVAEQLTAALGQDPKPQD